MPNFRRSPICSKSLVLILKFNTIKINQLNSASFFAIKQLSSASLSHWSGNLWAGLRSTTPTEHNLPFDSHRDREAPVSSCQSTPGSSRHFCNSLPPKKSNRSMTTTLPTRLPVRTPMYAHFLHQNIIGLTLLRIDISTNRVSDAQSGFSTYFYSYAKNGNLFLIVSQTGIMYT